MAFDTVRKKFAKEHIWYVEIEVDGATYRFCENRAPRPYGLEAVPSLKGVNISPAEIDLNGGIGVRARCNLTLEESMDYKVWGTLTSPVRFWSRWRAENPYYLGERLSVFSGYIVNDEFNPDNFVRRDYIIESFSQTASGVRIVGKDPLKLANNDRAKAPRESLGSLVADITDSQTSFTLQPTGIGSEYPSSNGIIRIGDEVLRYSSISGDDVIGVSRGEFNTQPDAHSEGDLVQICLEYASETVDDIGYDLLVNYANIDPSYINQAEWSAEVSGAFVNTYSVLITEPTGVQELIGEFAQSAPHYYFWDERVNRIRLKALQPPPADAQRLNWESNFIAGSTGVQDKQDMRISTVIINYGIFDPTKDLDEVSNYRASYVREDTDSVTNYGQRAYKTINSRWISSDNKTAAVLAAARIGRRFSDAPRMISFDVDAKDADFWTGDSVSCQTDLIEQPGGGYPYLPYQIISASERNNYQYSALEHTYGDPVPGDEDVEDPNVRLVFISGNQDRLSDPDTGSPRNLRDLFESVYGTGTLDSELDIRFIFESNAVAGSSDNTEYAVKTGSWPELTTPILISNAGLILGKGGDGANVGGIPEDGGSAIQLEDDIRLDNAGTIASGGAGGEGRSDSGPGVEVRAAGGGGAGYTNGIAGSVTTVIPAAQTLSTTQAENGTNTEGGTGGNARGRSTTGEIVFINGEAGGDLGQAATLASTGKAIDLNGFTITYVETGTIIGDVS